MCCIFAFEVVKNGQDKSYIKVIGSRSRSYDQKRHVCVLFAYGLPSTVLLILLAIHYAENSVDTPTKSRRLSRPTGGGSVTSKIRGWKGILLY